MIDHMIHLRLPRPARSGVPNHGEGEGKEATELVAALSADATEAASAELGHVPWLGQKEGSAGERGMTERVLLLNVRGSHCEV
jgi:hypothetical protein